MNFLQNIPINTMLRRGILPLLGVLVTVIGLTACGTIFENRDDCEEDIIPPATEFVGVRLRFVYDYHMERGANAFGYNVDCLKVLVFDSEGNYKTHFDEIFTTFPTDDSYRMILPLEKGDYRLVVYGGLTCSHARFNLTPENWDDGSATKSTGYNSEDILVSLPLNNNGESNIQLHNTEDHSGGLFYGKESFALTDEDMSSEYKDITVHLMKNTNNIQVILQELDDPYQVDYRDFDFRIVDDNFVLDGENNAVKTATEDFQPAYTYYAAENRIMGYVEYQSSNGALLQEDESRPVQVACAEFSTSRLFLDHEPTARLVVTSRKVNNLTGKPETVIDLPLITYLSATFGFGDKWIKSEQEYLDRQSRWTLMLFLEHNLWRNVRISVNWWTVRINNVEY